MNKADHTFTSVFRFEGSLQSFLRLRISSGRRGCRSRDDKWLHELLIRYPHLVQLLKTLVCVGQSRRPWFHACGTRGASTVLHASRIQCRLTMQRNAHDVLYVAEIAPSLGISRLFTSSIWRTSALPSLRSVIATCSVNTL